MIFSFRLISDEVEDFYRDIEISDDQTFLDFHNAIQQELKFDNSQLASFFTCTDDWEREDEITLVEMDTPGDKLIMDDVLLKDHIVKQRQRLVYLFDYFSNRTFFIELISISNPDKTKKYPLCKSRKGEAPIQILFDEASLLLEDDTDDLAEKKSAKTRKSHLEDEIMDEFNEYSEYDDEHDDRDR